MHIVFVTTEFKTESMLMGGLATYVDNMSSILRTHGHEVTVVTLSNTKNGFTKLQNGIAVERIRQSDFKCFDRDCKMIRFVLNAYRVRARLDKICKKKHVDVIQYTNCQGIGLFKLSKVAAVLRISCEETLWRVAKEKNYKYAEDINKVNGIGFMHYLAMARFQHIFGPSKVIADILSLRLHRRIKIIESPFSLPQLHSNNHIYTDRLIGKKYLLTHSSLSRVKGIHVILAVIEEILKENPDLYWVFIGNDLSFQQTDTKNVSIYSQIRDTAGAYADRVICMGAVPRNKLYPIIEGSFACVQPSRIDNFPNCCIEAMALGKVVIGTYGASYEQLICNRENGVLVKIDSAESLKKGIDYVIRMDNETRNRMEKNAVDTVKRLNPEVIYEQLLTYYTECINYERKIKKRCRDEKKRSASCS